MPETTINIISEDVTLELVSEEVSVDFIQETAEIDFIQENVTANFQSQNVVLNFPSGVQGPPGDPGVGVPPGGNAGQVLAKIDGDDYNTEWVDQSGGGGGATIESDTYANWETARAAGELTPGATIIVTDRADLGMILQVADVDAIGVSGVGGFLNADFQGVGNYDGVQALSAVPYYIYYDSASGAFTVGETITGDDNGSTAVVVSDDENGTLEVSDVSGDWTTETAFQGGDSGATANATGYDEGSPGIAAGTQHGIWRQSFEALTITYTNLSGGTFAAGDTITGTNTGATAVILTDDGASSMTAYMTSPGVAFDGSEQLDNGNGVAADQDGAATGPMIQGGDIVIWNLLHWQLTNAANLDGTDPATNVSAYVELQKASANVGYIEEWDVIEFDWANDSIQYRQDLRGGLIRGATAVSGYQFGRDACVGNNIQSPATLDIRNLIGAFNKNTILPGVVVSSIVTGIDTLIENNIIENGGSLTGITAGANCSISKNKIGPGATLGTDSTLGDSCTVNDNVLGASAEMINLTLAELSVMNGNNIGGGGAIRNIELQAGGEAQCSFNNLSTDAFIDGITMGLGGQLSSNIVKAGGTITGITAGESCSIQRNEVGQGATIGGNISLFDGCEIIDNFLQSSAFIQDIEAQDVSYVKNNAIEQNAGIYNIVFAGPNGEIKENEISVNIGFGNKTIGANAVISANKIGLDFSATQVFADDFFIDARTIISGLSNASAELDITGLTTLDCLAANNYVGIFNLTSSNATESIDLIQNPPTAFPITIRPAAGLTLTVTGTAYSGIAAGQIALKATDYTLDGDKGEYIVLEIDPLGTGALIEKQAVNGLI